MVSSCWLARSFPPSAIACFDFSYAEVYSAAMRAPIVFIALVAELYTEVMSGAMEIPNFSATIAFVLSISCCAFRPSSEVLSNKSESSFIA